MAQGSIRHNLSSLWRRMMFRILIRKPAILNESDRPDMVSRWEMWKAVQRIVDGAAGERNEEPPKGLLRFLEVLDTYFGAMDRAKCSAIVASEVTKKMICQKSDIGMMMSHDTGVTVTIGAQATEQHKAIHGAWNMVNDGVAGIVQKEGMGVGEAMSALRDREVDKMLATRQEELKKKKRTVH